MEKFAAYEQRMKKENLSQAAIDAFRANFDQLVSGATGLVSLSLSSAGSSKLQLRHLLMNMPPATAGPRERYRSCA